MSESLSLREAVEVANKFNDTVFTNTQEMVEAVERLARVAQSILESEMPANYSEEKVKLNPALFIVNKNLDLCRYQIARIKAEHEEAL